MAFDEGIGGGQMHTGIDTTNKHGSWEPLKRVDYVRHSTLSAAMNNTKIGNLRLDTSQQALHGDQRNGQPSQLDASAPVWTPTKAKSYEDSYLWSNNNSFSSSPSMQFSYEGQEQYQDRRRKDSRPRTPGARGGSRDTRRGSRKSSFSGQRFSPWQPSSSPDSHGIMIQNVQDNMKGPGSPMGSSPSSPGTGVFIPGQFRRQESQKTLSEPDLASSLPDALF